MDELELNINLNKWFNKNYSYLFREVKNNISNGQMERYAEDLLHIVIEGFLGKKHDMKLQMYQDNKISNWILRACSFQIKSGTSPFYNHIRKYYDRHYGFSSKFDYPWFNESQFHGETLYDCFKREMENLNWYEAKLIDLKYFQNYTYTQLNLEFGLPLSTLKSEYEEVFAKIRTACKHC